MLSTTVVKVTDPVTVVIKECINLSTAMRKYSKFTSQSSVSALLSGSSEIFNDGSNGDYYPNSLIDNRNPKNKSNDPLLSGFIQLRLILNKSNTLADIDSLTLIQPFLLVITKSSISGYITSLALDSIQKFINLNIINDSSKNYVITYREIVNALTHCKFDGPEQQAKNDDMILLKIVTLLNTVINSQHCDILSDSIIYEIIQITMSLACNKRRTELLRKAAESTMMFISVKIFSRLNHIESSNQNQIYINDESYLKTVLKVDVLGGDKTFRNNEKIPEVTPESENVDYDDISKIENETKKEGIEIQENITTEDDATIIPQVLDPSSGDNYGLPVIKLYFNLLLSLIVPENQTKHTNSTKILALQLINTAIEICGDRFLLHPQLFNIISDPIFRCALFLIQNTNKLSLLQATLQLFTTLFINMGNYLNSQIELTLNRIFEVLLEGTDDSENNSKANTEPKNNTGNDNKSKIRPPKVKELLIEQISILWTRSPSFFTSMFISYDCNLDTSDIAINFLKALTKLSLPESVLTTTETVPPICLEGLVSFVDDIYGDLQNLDRQKFMEEKATVELLKQRDRKTAFIKCVEAFNEKPKNGIPLLIEKGFIKSGSDKDISEFLFENNGRMNKKNIGLLICDPKKTDLLKEFISLFDFKGLRVDEAIRILLTKFRLPGESQQIERIVEAFSSSYVFDQQYDVTKSTESVEDDIGTVQPDSDSVFVLSYAIIMLNTDLHNPQVKEHMSFADYSSNLKGCYNSNDFPHWYLDKIYCSIRDKEIVMPEEHHGNDKWFEDAWNNLISSTTVMTEMHEDHRHIIEKYSSVELTHFNRAIFKNVGPSILSTLFKIFVAASDDHITTRMLASIEKCSTIASYYNFKSLFNDVLRNISKITTLLVPESDGSNGESNTIPLIEVTLENQDSKIPVSSRSVRLGRSFKGQLSSIVFFRIIRRNSNQNMIAPNIWSDVVQIILNLYENLLFQPDVFPEFQQRLSLEQLPSPKPAVSLNKAMEARGLFSSFASYLKGDEEPTSDEVDAAVKALSCIKSSDITSSIFGNETNITPDLIKLFLEAIPEKKTGANERYYEAEILFLIEISIGLFFFYKDAYELGDFILQKVIETLNISDLSNNTYCRLDRYILILLSVLDHKQEVLLDVITKDILGNRDIFTESYFSTSEGVGLVKKLLSLTDIANYRSFLFEQESFWKILRTIAPLHKQGVSIYEYLNKLLLETHTEVTSDAFIHILGILDEISSIGSVGSNWETEYEALVKSGHKVNNASPHNEIIQLSSKSLDLTCKLIEDKNIFDKLGNAEKFTLVQVITHQCQNPCKQLRLHAVAVLETALTKHMDSRSVQITEVEELIDGGVLPLLETNTTHVEDILQIVGKVYKYYLTEGKANNETFLKILNIFNRFVDNPEIEKQLQELIMAKKQIEKISSPARPQ